MFVQKNPLIWEIFVFSSVNFMVMWFGGQISGRFLQGGTVQGILEAELTGGNFQNSKYPTTKLHSNILFTPDSKKKVFFFIVSFLK